MKQKVVEQATNVSTSLNSRKSSTNIEKISSQCSNYWKMREELMLKKSQAEMAYIQTKMAYKKERHDAKMALIYNNYQSYAKVAPSSSDLTLL